MQIIQQLIGFFHIIVPPLELFRGAALALCGAIASKCVESHELGKLLMYVWYLMKCLLTSQEPIFKIVTHYYSVLMFILYDY